MKWSVSWLNTTKEKRGKTSYRQLLENTMVGGDGHFAFVFDGIQLTLVSIKVWSQKN